MNAYEMYAFMQQDNLKNILQPNESGALHISFDGLFGLCRKKSAGRSVRPPLWSGRYFLQQDAVDTYIDNYGHCERPNQVCL